MMGYIIIDLEFNNMQSITKYYPKIYDEYAEIKNLSIDNEIIEIGAVKLNKFMQKIDEYKTYIKPEAFKILNPKITEITGITEKDLETGKNFKSAMDELKSFVGESQIICSWATDDIVHIIDNANYHNYKNIQWIKEYLDIQEYCTKILAHKKVLSLKNALDELKIKVDKSKLHDALNDANYTAEVFKRLYNNKIVKNYIVKDVYNMPSIRIKELKKYNIENYNIDFLCPKCNIEVDREHPLRLFSWRFLSLGKCPKCNHKLLQEVVLKKTLSDEVVFNKVNSILSDIEYMDMAYKFKRAQNHSNNKVNKL